MAATPPSRRFGTAAAMRIFIGFLSRFPGVKAKSVTSGMDDTVDGNLLLKRRQQREIRNRAQRTRDAVRRRRILQPVNRLHARKQPKFRVIGARRIENEAMVRVASAK